MILLFLCVVECGKCFQRDQKESRKRLPCNRMKICIPCSFRKYKKGFNKFVQVYVIVDFIKYIYADVHRSAIIYGLIKLCLSVKTSVDLGL